MWVALNTNWKTVDGMPSMNEQIVKRQDLSGTKKDTNYLFFLTQNCFLIVQTQATYSNLRSGSIHLNYFVESSFHTNMEPSLQNTLILSRGQNLVTVVVSGWNSRHGTKWSWVWLLLMPIFSMRTCSLFADRALLSWWPGFDSRGPLGFIQMKDMPGHKVGGRNQTQCSCLF